MSRNQNIGKWGEEVAADYLSNKGYTVLAQNVRTPYGEIDLIVEQNSLLIFVEVKTRTSSQFGYPEAAIRARKQASMHACAEHYIGEKELRDRSVRLDVIAINASPDLTHYEVEWFENVSA